MLDRIIDYVLGKLGLASDYPDDPDQGREPCLLLKARDPLAATMTRAYAFIGAKHGMIDHEEINRLFELALRMDEWREEHEVPALPQPETKPT